MAKLINMALPWHQHLANISFDIGCEGIREHTQTNNLVSHQVLVFQQPKYHLFYRIKARFI